MREILFRGKAINRNKGYHRTNYKNGDWVYGLFTRSYDERFESLPAEMRNTDGIGGLEIDYRTIGQYTGLTDRNGKKIFEGDIVNFSDILYYIVFADGCFRIGRNGQYSYTLHNIHSAFEIIGNIHDNPELLEVK